jgi:hypothetical protein
VDDSFKGVWPDGLAKTLWNYDQLHRGADGLPLQFMGFKPDWNFLLAYLLGIGIILLFARRRFSERSFEPADGDYEVLKKLAPTQLRGVNATRQAYFYYASVLVVLYSVMTFFAWIVFTILNAIPMAGLQLDVSPDKFNSSAWPLTLALAFAGFTQLLKPLELAEGWLRQRAHLWVGIPVRIKERTRKLLDRIDKEIRADEVAKRERLLKDWAKARIKNGVGATQLARDWLAVEKMAAVIKDDNSWPDISVLESMRSIVTQEMQRANVAMQQLRDISSVGYNDPAKLQDEEDVPDGGKKKLSEEENLARHHRQLRTMLDTAVAEIDRSKEELCAILAVYAERSASSGKIGNDTIKGAVRTAFPNTVKLDTAFWLGVSLVPTVVVYVLAASFQLHGLLGTVKLGVITVLATALIETLRICMLFWLPLLIVLGWRQYLIDANHWHRFGFQNFSRQTAVRSIQVVLLAGGTAVLGLALVAVAWMAIIAENPERFRTILLASKQPALLYHVSAAFSSVVFVFIVTWVADCLERTPSKSKAVVLGLVGALVVTLMIMAHAAFWNEWNCGSVVCQVKTKYEGFAKVYTSVNGTDFIVAFCLTFLCASVFVWPVRPEFASSLRVKWTRKSTSIEIVGRGARKASAPVFVLLAVSSTLFFLSTSAPSVAANRDTNHGEKYGTRTVQIGVRTDAEPFSYKAGPYGDRKYAGYVVDLCYDIFKGSEYSVVPVEISADNRFSRLKGSKDEGDDAAKVDILCEPTTLRYDRDVEQANGIFSPIIFVSGVSYLMRSTRVLSPPTYLAFVQGTTAEDVVKLACANDLFSVRDDGQRASDGECFTRARYNPLTGAVRGLVDSCPPAAAAVDEADSQKYHICQFRDHDKLISWFCSPPDSILKAKLVYFGDSEIIQAKLASWKANGKCDAQDVEKPQTYYTYEPYALLISSEDPCLVQFVQRRVYEFFSFRKAANNLFSTYFPDSQMSPVLANLFLLNAVDEEPRFRVPDFRDEAGPDDDPGAMPVPGAACYQESKRDRWRSLLTAAVHAVLSLPESFRMPSL